MLDNMATMDEVTPQEGQRRVQAGALLIDVREPNEYAEVHATGAQLMPLSGFEQDYGSLPKDREIVLICRSGGRSARAGEFLLKQGYDKVTNLAGGTTAWVEGGLPSEAGEA